MKTRIEKLIQTENRQLFKALNFLGTETIMNFSKLYEYSINALKNKKKIILYGNGGSASDSQHLATELVVRYKKNRRAIPAIALTADNSAITAISNDFNFKFIFSRQIEALGHRGDIAIALTTSGNSQNLIEAAKLCKKKGIITFCFSGNKGGKLKKFTRYPITLNSKVASTIQVIELHLGQIYCGLLEEYTKK